ncbi:hypothetical protein AB5N19_07537 [Seiridium cardinale]
MDFCRWFFSCCPAREDDVESGRDTLSDGSGALSDGSGALSDGSGALSDGSGALSDGRGALSDSNVKSVVEQPSRTQMAHGLGDNPVPRNKRPHWTSKLRRTGRVVEPFERITDENFLDAFDQLKKDLEWLQSFKGKRTSPVRVNQPRYATGGNGSSDQVYDSQESVYGGSASTVTLPNLDHLGPYLTTSDKQSGTGADGKSIATPMDGEKVVVGTAKRVNVRDLVSPVVRPSVAPVVEGTSDDVFVVSDDRDNDSDGDDVTKHSSTLVKPDTESSANAGGVSKDDEQAETDSDGDVSNESMDTVILESPPKKKPTN